MKTQEGLEHKLFNQTEEVCEAMLKLQKASMILDHWVTEYGFQERPEPTSAIAWGSAICPGENTGGEQFFKWFYEYNRIYQFIDIVHDYVYESKKILEKVVYGEEENKGA